MEQKPNQIHRLVQETIERDSALTVAELKRLRNRSEQQVKTAKISFWAAIAVINLMIWVPLPFTISISVLIVIGILCVGFAFSYPIITIRKHQQCLEALKLAPRGPKRRSAGDAGQHYIDRVKEEGRSFVQAELDILEGGKHTAQ